MQKLSVCIVTKNEEKNIRECLESVKWADEIVVIDSESTDNTVAICREYTDKILVTPWKGCGPQKKHAQELASNDWVLILDADERVTPKLATEIQKQLRATNISKIAGFQIPFESYYCGKRIRFGDWLFEKHLRLYRRSAGGVIPRLVHFRVELKGKVMTLNGKIKHYSFPDLRSVINKMNVYSTDGAQHKYEEGNDSGLMSAIGHGVFAFFRSYFLKLGFLDGKAGFLLAFAIAEGSYYRYVKLMEMNRGI